MGVRWSERLVVDGRLSQEVLKLLPCRGKRETVFVGVTGESHSWARERSQVWTRCERKPHLGNVPTLLL